MEFPSEKLELKELIQPGIFKANATDICGVRGVSIVVVKTTKDTNNAYQRESLLHELDIMLNIIPHDNVIRLIGCMITSGTPKPSIIMEFANYDNLKPVLLNSRKERAESAEEQDDSVYSNMFEDNDSVTSEKLLLFCEQIANGMQHISSLGIIHRKLGARNVFVGKNEVCKIASFSKAIRTDDPQVIDKRENRLPIRWMAPESLSKHVFSTKTDVWAYGIVMWEIVTLGALPYTGMKNKEISAKIASGYRMEKPPHCTPQLYDVMLRCWNKNADYRPGFGQLVQEITIINNQKEGVNLSEYDSDIYGDVEDI
ncbi:tyrosine-protein kinase receptor Tie-1-like [Saccoglossus kowalevskii]